MWLLCYLNSFLLFWSSTMEKSSQDNLLNICFCVSLKIASHTGLKQHEESYNFTNNLSLSCYWSLWINSQTSYLKLPYFLSLFWTICIYSCVFFIFTLRVLVGDLIIPVLISQWFFWLGAQAKWEALVVKWGSNSPVDPENRSICGPVSFSNRLSLHPS